MLLAAFEKMRVVFEQGRELSGTLQLMAMRAGGLTCRGMKPLEFCSLWRAREGATPRAVCNAHRGRQTPPKRGVAPSLARDFFEGYDAAENAASID